ncbi:MAG TPA: NAD(P)-dependent oxidoreductase [Pirellulales bacterium]|jgi:nucleoside-diphosphate-sugar epimerase|nr:NAD(P)-dependent oxidoreductase [Pirellulales bacterium]
MSRTIHNVLITGASGKLGVPLSRALLKAGYRVLALRHRAPVNVDGVEEVAGSVSDARLIEELVARSDAVIHLATCKEDRDALLSVSVQGTFNLLEAAQRTGRPKRVILASGDAVNGIYYHPQPVAIREDLPLAAYPGYYALSKVLEETLFRQYYCQAGLPTVCLRISWIHADDDILNHLTTAGESFGVPVWGQLMDHRQRELYEGSPGAAVALRHPDGQPLRRQIVAVDDVVSAFLLALEREAIEGETFLIAMTDPFDYADAAQYVARKLNIDTVDLVDPIGHDFCIDTTKARNILGYRPKTDIYQLIDEAVDFRRLGRRRRPTSGYRG